jgi:hypothetical protein
MDKLGIDLAAVKPKLLALRRGASLAWRGLSVGEESTQERRERQRERDGRFFLSLPVS